MTEPEEKGNLEKLLRKLDESDQISDNSLDAQDLQSYLAEIRNRIEDEALKAAKEIKGIFSRKEIYEKVISNRLERKDFDGVLRVTEEIEDNSEKTITYVDIADKLYRAKPISIMGRKVKFYRLTQKMFGFGMKGKTFSYSDPEKTALDLLHLKHYTKPEFESLAEKLSVKKLIKYSKNYRKKIIQTVNGLKNV